MPSNLFLFVGPIIACVAWIFALNVLSLEVATESQSYLAVSVWAPVALAGVGLASPFLLYVWRSNLIETLARRWGARYQRCVSAERVGEWCPSWAASGWDKVRNVVQLDVDGFTVTAFDQFRFVEWGGSRSRGEPAKWPLWQTRVVVAGCEIPDDLVLKRIGTLSVASDAAEKFVRFERTEWLCFPWNVRRFMLRSVALVKTMQEELAQLRSSSVSGSHP